MIEPCEKHLSPTGRTQVAVHRAMLEAVESQMVAVCRDVYHRAGGLLGVRALHEKMFGIGLGTGGGINPAITGDSCTATATATATATVRA